MSDITPKVPKTAAEIKARNMKIRYFVFDLFMPVIAAFFLILSILWPQTVFVCLAGISMGTVLIRFATTRYKSNSGMLLGDRLAMIGGIILILLALARLVIMILSMG